MQIKIKNEITKPLKMILFVTEKTCDETLPGIALVFCVSAHPQCQIVNLTHFPYNSYEILSGLKRTLEMMS